MAIKAVDKAGVRYYIIDIPDFSDIKQSLVDDINNHQSARYDDVSRTDWNVDVDGVRKYFAILWDKIKPVMDELYLDVIYTDQYVVGNVWFQQYGNKSTHGWHSHMGCWFAHCAFIELPDGASSTELISPETKEIIKTDVKEGQMIVMPSYILHRSAPNNSQENKTVIVFNV